MSPDLLVKFLMAILSDAPELVMAVEKLVADLKSPPTPGPITPDVVKDMADPLAKLEK